MVDPARLEQALDGLAGDAGLQSALRDWIRWLRDERRSSPHTVDAYTRDLSGFLTFIAGHLGALPTLAALETLAAQDFRAWLARRSNDGLERTSTARALSVLRGFFVWLERNDRARNHAIRTVRTPKQPNAVPKPLDGGCHGGGRRYRDFGSERIADQLVMTYSMAVACGFPKRSV